MHHGLICGRFQPLHLGHISLIKRALENCKLLTIAIGSAQSRLDNKNPYSYLTRKKMIENVFPEEIKTKLKIIPVSDINDPPKWADHVINTVYAYNSIAEIDIYFAGSNEDADLFSKQGLNTIIQNREDFNFRSGTEIRQLIKDGNPLWKDFTPEVNWSILDQSIWVASTNEESFSCSEEYFSREEAIKNAPEDHVLSDGDGFFIGKKRMFEFKSPNSELILDTLLGQHEDETGEWAEDWVSQLYQDKDLTQFITKKSEEICNYIMMHHKPTFFLVDNIESVHAGE